MLNKTNLQTFSRSLTGYSGTDDSINRAEPVIMREKHSRTKSEPVLSRKVKARSSPLPSRPFIDTFHQTKSAQPSPNPSATRASSDRYRYYKVYHFEYQEFRIF